MRATSRSQIPLIFSSQIPQARTTTNMAEEASPETDVADKDDMPPLRPLLVDNENTGQNSLLTLQPGQFLQEIQSDNPPVTVLGLEDIQQMMTEIVNTRLKANAISTSCNAINTSPIKTGNVSMIKKRKFDEISIGASSSASYMHKNVRIDPQLSEEDKSSGLPESVEDNMSNYSDLFGQTPGFSARSSSTKSRSSTSSSASALSARNNDDSKNDTGLDMIKEILIQVDKELPLHEKLGPSINEALAERIKRQYLTESQNSDTRKLINARHKVPGNCKELLTPTINKSIKTMKAYKGPRSRVEKDLYNIQQCVLKGTVAITTLCEKALVCENESRVLPTIDLFRHCLDAITMMGHANSELNTRRKSNLQWLLSPDVRSICSSENKPTTELLGDDLGKSLKEARDINRIQNKYTSSSSISSDRNSRSSRGSSYDFLERGKNSHTSSHRDRNQDRSQRYKKPVKKGKKN